MSFASINLQQKLNKPKFWLCKPNKERIHPLNDVYGESLSVKLGAINDLSFTFPTFVLRNNTYVKNPLLSKLKGHYLVEMAMNGKKEYFIILKQTKSYSNSDEFVTVQCYGLGYELNQRYIRSVEEISVTLRQLVTIFLEGTAWTIDYIDVDVELLHRSYEASSVSRLQGIFDIAEKFNCIVEFDTVDRKLSFKKYDNVGLNRGITAKEGKYLESFNLEIDDEKVVTRLVAYGQDGLTFRSLSPTGVNYIQDFTWFMYPFECDENYNVIKHSKYMSDELCIALTKYQALLDDLDFNFEVLHNLKTFKDSQITVAQNQLTDLKGELKGIEYQLDVLNATYGDGTTSKPEHQTLVTNRTNKLSQISSKESEIATLKVELTNIENDITSLYTQLDTENNFTQAELEELKGYIHEQEYTNDSITEIEDLLEEAYLVFDDYKQPPLSLSISLEAFSDHFDTKLINRLHIGDTIRLKSQSLEVEVKAKITQIDYDFDDLSVNITVSNVRGLLDNDELFAKDLNNAINTSNTVNLDKYKWKQGENANTLVNQILTGEFNTAKNVLLGGTANSVTITERGLFSRDLQDENTFLALNNGMLAITPDGGNSVAVAISKNGVHADKLIGRIIMSNQTYVQSDTGVIHMNGDTATFYDTDERKRVEIGKYEDPNNAGSYKYGLRIHDGAFDLRSTSENNKGIQIDVNGIRGFNSNGVKSFEIDANTGLATLQNKFVVQSTDTSNRGFKIDENGIHGYNSSGTRTFHVDTNGYLTATSGTFSGTVNGGQIISNTSIDVTTDVNVGNKLYIGVNNQNIRPAIHFAAKNSVNLNSSGYITYHTELNNLEIASPSNGGIHLNAKYIDFNNAVVSNLQVVAVWG